MAESSTITKHCEFFWLVSPLLGRCTDRTCVFNKRSFRTTKQLSMQKAPKHQHLS